MINCPCGKIMFDKTYDELAKEHGFKTAKKCNLSYFTHTDIGRISKKCECGVTNLLALEK